MFTDVPTFKIFIENWQPESLMKSFCTIHILRLIFFSLSIGLHYEYIYTICERRGLHLNANFTQLLRESTNDSNTENMQIEYILKITSSLAYSFGITARNIEIPLIRYTQF